MTGDLVLIAVSLAAAALVVWRERRVYARHQRELRKQFWEQIDGFRGR